jgi:2-polyprenyl-3-methyl-5-hydroxy-6-metoxy-1,4-benzoquinol methylase
LSRPVRGNSLDFRLPDFTRIAWASDDARSVWKPRLAAISAAQSQIQLQSVVDDARACGLTSLGRRELNDLRAHVRQAGLDLVLLDYEGVSRFPYASSRVPPKLGRSMTVRVAFGRTRDVHLFNRLWGARDDRAIGAMLGYPACCCDFFEEVWNKARSVDPTWRMAADGAANSSEDVIELQGSYLNNMFWRWMGVRPVFHLPCSTKCSATRRVARTLRRVGLRIGLDTELAWQHEVLSWPLEWSALHGIAEIKTPIMRVVTRTDATRTKRTVRWLGSPYPEEGATGVGFPFHQTKNRRAHSTRHSSSPESSSRSWYYTDNGFSSLSAMKRCHAPLVRLAEEWLAGRGGNVIDLGCGNGVLVKTICQKGHNLVPFGIDLREERLRHAKVVNPTFGSHFRCANLFDPAIWKVDRTYVLAILMAARLLEVDERTRRELLTNVRARCDSLLVYVYPDRDAQPFSQLLEALGLDGAHAASSSAALLPLREPSVSLPLAHGTAWED